MAVRAQKCVQFLLLCACKVSGARCATCKVREASCARCILCTRAAAQAAAQWWRTLSLDERALSSYVHPFDTPLAPLHAIPRNV